MVKVTIDGVEIEVEEGTTISTDTKIEVNLE